MGRHGFPPITQLSAALTLVQWTSAHGREPRCGDCAGSDGLFWFTTYYKCFQTNSWSAVLAMAHDITSGLWSALSSVATARRMKRCLNWPDCAESILDEGNHIRFCRRCRQRQTQQGHHINSDYLEPMFTRTRLERWGLGRDGWQTSILEGGGE